MQLKDVKTIEQCQYYIEGLLNDYDLGIISRSELLKDSTFY